MVGSGRDGLRLRKGSLEPLSTTDFQHREGRGRGGKEAGMGKREAAGSVEMEEEEEPMSPGARMFHQPRFNCYIIAMMGIGKKIDVDVLKAGLESTLVRHPRFSSVQVLEDGEPRWVRTKVVTENHLVVVEPNPDRIGCADTFVEDYVAGLSSTALADFSRPLWDLHVLNLGTSDAEAVAVLRIHHSFGDGISLISLLLACTRKAADPDSLPSLPAAAAGGVRRGLPKAVVAEDAKGWWCRVLGFLVGLCRALRVSWNTVVDVLLFVATVAFLKDTETPVTGKEGVELRPKRFVHRRLCMEDVKAVKRATGSTVNDVLLGVTSAGLTRYLCRRYERERGDGRSQLPKNIRMRSAVLVNLRPSPGIHALADMMEEGNKHNKRWGNWLGYVIVPFSIVKREDPLGYIRAAKAIADRKKCSLESIFTYRSALLIIKTLGIKIAAALSHRVLMHTTLSFSNVIGPVEEIAFFGHPLVYIAPSVHGHPHALTVHFQSYMDKMELVVAVDESVIPDPHQLCADVAESLKEIQDAAIARNSQT